MSHVESGIVGLTIAAVIVCAGSGCDAPQPMPDYGQTESTDLKAAVQATQELLNTDPLPGNRETDLRTYLYLSRGLGDPKQRSQAEDSLFVLCHSDTTNFLWLEVAVLKYRALRRKDEYRALRARLDPDTTSTVGHFFYGRRFWGRRAGATDHFRRARRLADQLDPLQAIWLEYRIAGSTPRAGPDRLDIGAFADKVGLAWSVGGAPMAAFWWCEISGHLLARDRLTDAMLAADLALACARDAHSGYLETLAGLARGSALEQLLAIDQAGEVFAGVYAQALVAGNGRHARRALGHMSTLARTRGDLSGERRMHTRFLALATAAADSYGIVQARLALSDDLLRAGEPDSALVHLQIASLVDKQRSGRRVPQDIDRGLAYVYALRGQYVLADSLWHRAYAAESAAGDRLDLLYLQIQLAAQALETGRPTAAARALARGAELETTAYQLGVDRDPRVGLAFVRSEFLRRCGRQREAALALARAESLDAGRSMEVAWEIAIARAQLETDTGDPAEAEQQARRALGLAVQLENPTHEHVSRIRLGDVLLAQNRFSEVEQLFAPDATVEHYWSRLAGHLLRGMACAGAGDHTSALNAYAAVADLLAADSPGDINARLQIETGRSLVAVGQPDAAAAAFAAARTILNSSHGASTVEFASFHSRARRDLAESVAALCVDEPGAIDSDPVQWSLQVSDEARWHANDYRLLPHSGEDTPRDGNAAAVYFVGRQRAFVWIGAAGKWRLHELQSPADLIRLADGVMAAAAQPAAKALDLTKVPEAIRLASNLLAEVVKVWQPESTLFLVPDATLSDLPWAALPLPGQPAEQSVITRGPLAMIDYWRGLPDGFATLPDSLSLLAVGVNGTSLDQAEAEARRVSADWNAGAATLHVGADAAWSEVLAAEMTAADVIHIATHAQVTAGLPGYSFLELGPNSADRVALLEIANLDLAANLVFLSCCDAGRQGSLSGLDNFARAFQRAGAGSIIATTIRVDDEAAAFLAQSFYRHWQAGTNGAAALRAAQLETMNSQRAWQHPYYWAFHRIFVR